MASHIHHNAHKQTLGNGKKMHSLCSTILLQDVSTYSGFLEISAVLGDFSFQVLEHFSPESQPVVFVNKVVKWLIYRSIFHSIFSFHSLASVVYTHFMKRSSIYLHPFFLFPPLFVHKETAKKKRQVRIYCFKIQLLTKVKISFLQKLSIF